MIKRQLRNLLWLHSYSLKDLLRVLPEFMFYYYFGNGRASMPLNITLELTNRCNLSCKGCFVDKHPAKELSFEQWSRFIKEKHARSYYIAGGEPFLRQDTLDILKLLKHANVGLTTNGTLLDEGKIKQLVKTKINYVIFSLDGPKEVHDMVRGKGVYDKLVRSISLLLKHRTTTRVYINSMVNPLNYKLLSQIPAIAKGLGVDGVSLQHFVYSGKKDFNIPLLQSEITKWKSECNRLKIKHYFKPHLNPEQVQQWYTRGYAPSRCLLPWNLVRINPQGGVYFCYPYTNPVGNITQQPLKAILNSDQAIAFRRMIKKGCQKECSRCCKG